MEIEGKTSNKLRADPWTLQHSERGDKEKNTNERKAQERAFKEAK